MVFRKIKEDLLRWKPYFFVCILSLTPIHLFAQTDTLQSDSSTVLPLKNTVKRPYYIIQSVIIEGNKITSSKIIRRELDFLEGDSIPAATADSLLIWERNKIFNLNLFVTVDVNLLKDDEHGLGTLLVRVKEQWFTIPQLILEPADRNLNEWIFQRGAALNRVNIGVKLFQKNCRGRNETLRLTFQTGFTHNYELSYSIPYLTKKQRMGMNLYFSYSNNRSLAYATKNNKLEYIKTEGIIRDFLWGGIGFVYRKEFFITHSVDMLYNYNTINDTVALLNPDYFMRGRKLQEYARIKYTYSNDRRDVKQFPHRGYAYKLELEQLGFTNYETQKLTRAFFTYQKYNEIGRHFLFATRFKAKASFPVQQPYIDFKALGYTQDFVRGYELYPVDGQHYLLSRNSFRYKLYSKILDFGKLMPVRQFRTFPVDIYLTLFSDLGYVYNSNPIRVYPLTISDNHRFSNALMGSIGAAVNLVTYYNSILRFEYSYNRAGELNFFFSMAADI